MAEVRYRAMRIWWVRAALGVVVVPLVLGLLAIGAVLLTLESVAGVLGALMCLAVALLAIAIVLLGTRLQFLVDDEGLTMVHYVRTHRIPWEQVAMIEQTGSYWFSGAVVVVLRDPPGRRIVALATGGRVALYRGENPFTLGDPRVQSHAATLAAIDAHRRWLAASGRY